MILDYPYVLTGALSGFLVGLTGVGGGALTTPILIMIFGVPPTTAVGTDLWFAVITKMAGALTHHNTGNTDWEVVKRLWWGSIPSSLIIIGLGIFGMPIITPYWLTKMIGIVVLVTATGLLATPMLFLFAKERRLKSPARFKRLQPLLTIVSGSILGFCVALTSIGAGTLGSVMLIYLYPLRMTPKRLVATDIAHAIPLAFVAGLGYLIAGEVNWQILVSLLMGSIPAVIGGSLIFRKIPSRSVQVLLASLLTLSGAKILGYL